MIEYLIDRIKGKAPKGARRHKDWRKVRNSYIKKQPTCELCGGTKRLQVHHIIPFWLAPELELDFNNLMTLCMSGRKGVKCHLLFGHHGDWQDINIHCENDVRRWRTFLK